MEKPIIDLSKFTNHVFYLSRWEESAELKQGKYLWRVADQTGRVIKQGYYEPRGEEFLDLYNNHYGTHLERTAEIAKRLGYTGELEANDLI
jgi:hypothetical protein